MTRDDVTSGRNLFDPKACFWRDGLRSGDSCSVFLDGYVATVHEGFECVDIRGDLLDFPGFPLFGSWAVPDELDSLSLGLVTAQVQIVAGLQVALLPNKHVVNSLHFSPEVFKIVFFQSDKIIRFMHDVHDNFSRFYNPLSFYNHPQKMQTFLTIVMPEYSG